MNRALLYLHMGRFPNLDDMVFTSVEGNPIDQCSVAFTIDTYSHIIEGMKGGAMALLE